MKKSASKHRTFSQSAIFTTCLTACLSTAAIAETQYIAPIYISPDVPSELNAAGGGAPMATPAQAAAFAWQEFIALNWPAGPQGGQLGQRDTPSSTCRFGSDAQTCRLLVWETFRSKVETFPGDGNPPPGYTATGGGTAWGYDHGPVYNYRQPIPACPSLAPGQEMGSGTSVSSASPPWVNLDETDQISFDNMYAGVAPSSSSGNTAPQLIRFLAKSNRSEYAYVAGNKWWAGIPTKIQNSTIGYLKANNQSPPPDSEKLVSFPFGTIEIKAAWRPLNQGEASSGRFHMQLVRFYEGTSTHPCFIDAIWGLVGLHIIQKTPSAPYFIFATFEQSDNILTADMRHVEDADGNVVLPQATAKTPEVCLIDPRAPYPPGLSNDSPSNDGLVTLTSDPAKCTPNPALSYCDHPTSDARLYYRNAATSQFNNPPGAAINQPSNGDICVNRRVNDIPNYVIKTNAAAHAAITAYLDKYKSDLGKDQANSDKQKQLAPWLSYKLVNVQYFPYDKVADPRLPNGSPYGSTPPYNASNPATASFYQANIVVETNRSLQLFSGGLANGIPTDWHQDGTPNKNTFYGGKQYNMGGCMGCHGAGAQDNGADFSFILGNGGVPLPEIPAQVTSEGLAFVLRFRNPYK